MPFFPDFAVYKGLDKWSGFPNQRAEILSFIEEKKIAKVVFFSGDVHASFSLALESPSGLKVHSVISSAFFSPYPHPLERYFDLDGDIDAGGAGTFKVIQKSSVCSDDNFTRLKIQLNGFTAEVFSRKGKRLSPILKYTW